MAVLEHIPFTNCNGPFLFLQFNYAVVNIHNLLTNKPDEGYFLKKALLPIDVLVLVTHINIINIDNLFFSHKKKTIIINNI